MSSSESELDESLLQMPKQVQKPASKRKRKGSSEDDDDDMSLEEESEWEDEEIEAIKPTKKRGQAAAKAGRGGKAGAAASMEFDKEELIEDEEDRARLAKMTEFQREMELADRAERRREELQRELLLRASEVGGAAAAKKKTPAKRGAGAARRSGREVREEDAKKSAIEELKAARQRKKQGLRAHESDEELEEEAGAGGEDSDYEEGEAPAPMRWAARDGVEGAEGAAEEHEDADFEEAKTIQVRRHKLEEWFTKPHFDTTLPGCLVRVVEGNVRDEAGNDVRDQRGQPMPKYILVQIVGVEELPAGWHKFQDSGPGWKSPYSFGPDGGKTSKWLKVCRGRAERYWPLAQVSNSGMTEEEFGSWQRACKRVDRPQISRREVEEVHGRLAAADTYVYTAADVARMLEEKRSKGQGGGNVALERARLERERDGAQEAGDAEKVAAAEVELQALEAAAVASFAKRGAGASMAMLNRKNAERNFQTAFKSGAKEEGGGGGGGDAGGLDPFSRRATRSTVYWNTQRQGGGSQLDLVAAGEEEMNGGGNAADKVGGRNGAGVVAAAVPITLVDLSGLDMSLLEGTAAVEPLARRLLGARALGMKIGGSDGAAVSGRPGISLAQYQQQHQQQRY